MLSKKIHKLLSEVADEIAEEILLSLSKTKAAEETDDDDEPVKPRKSKAKEESEDDDSEDDDSEDDDSDDDEDDETEVTKEDVVKAFKKFTAAQKKEVGPEKSRKAALKILKGFKATHIDELGEDDYAAVIEALEND